MYDSSLSLSMYLKNKEILFDYIIYEKIIIIY